MHVRFAGSRLRISSVTPAEPGGLASEEAQSKTKIDICVWCGDANGMSRKRNSRLQGSCAMRLWRKARLVLSRYPAVGYVLKFIGNRDSLKTLPYITIAFEL